MRSLGIDFGEKRIGLAISDPAGRLAVPLTTLERRNDRSALRQIAEIARAGGGRAAGARRAGGPLRQPRARSPSGSARFGERLAELTGLPVEWVDEALTSVEAAERLRQAGVDTAARAGADRRGGRPDPAAGRPGPGRPER